MSHKDMHRPELAPSPNTFPAAKRGESFDHAANKPNDPGVDQDIFDNTYNVNTVYGERESD
jgi:hypothetical protein